MILSAAWSIETDIARHEYKGLSKMAYALEDWVEKSQQESLETNRRPVRSPTIRGGHHNISETND